MLQDPKLHVVRVLQRPSESSVLEPSRSVEEARSEKNAKGLGFRAEGLGFGPHFLQFDGRYSGESNGKEHGT